MDVVSGATLTSQTILDAAAKAVKESGLDPAKFLLVPAGAAVKKAADSKLSVQIVVLGSGAAGMAAALSAAENGASNIVLLEKQQMLGGSTGRSSGCILHATDEKDKLNNFPPQALYDFWMSRSNGKADPALIRKIAKNSKATFEWVRDAGVKFSSFKPVYPGYAPLHLENPDPKGGFVRTNGMLIVEALKNKAEKLGLKIMTGTAGESLICEDGKVVGVVAKRTDGRTVTIRSQAVVLATGGYDHNLDMVRQYARPTAAVLSQTGEGNNGDGLRMGQEIGADTLFRYGKGGIVTVKVDATANMPKSFLYVDGLEAAVKNGKALKADSLSAPAQKMRIDADNFAKTVTRCNNLTQDVDFGKAPDLMKGIRKAPFYAVRAEPEVIGTFGGLRINTDGQVLRGGKPVAGLYAAGEVANGVLYDDSYSYTGTAIQTALSTGRFAGTHAAKTLKK